LAHNDLAKHRADCRSIKPGKPNT